MRINPDNPLIRLLGLVFDTVVTVSLGLICCLPVLTVGPALTALNATMMAVAADECSGVLRTFFGVFRREMKQGFLLGLLLTGLGAVVALDLWVCWGFRHEPSLMVSVCRGLTVFAVVVYLGWGSYLLPGLAQFQVTNRQAIRNAAVWAVTHPGCTIGLIATKLLSAAAVYMLWYLCFPVLWIAGYVDARILNRVFGVRVPPNRELELKNQEIYYE